MKAKKIKIGQSFSYTDNGKNHTSKIVDIQEGDFMIYFVLADGTNFTRTINEYRS